MDTRRVQTAVLGSAESDDAVVCPFDADELDAFRAVPSNSSLWCGYLLGGCGKPLMTRRYTDKVCHFAHHPQAQVEHRCTRTANGENSADHLFVKTALDRWLRNLGHHAEYDYPRPLGSQVIATLDDGLEIRAHLDPATPVDWTAAGTAELLLGPRVLADPSVLAERGLVHRIRFERSGATRAVIVGTQTQSAGTSWFALEQCLITPNGIQTPAPARPEAVSRPASAPTRSSAAPATVVIHSAGPVPQPVVDDADRRLATRLRSAVQTERTAEVRNLVAAAELRLQDGDPGVEQLLAPALGRARAWLDTVARRRSTVFARLKEDLDAKRNVRSMYDQARALVEADTDTTDEERALLCTAGDRLHEADRQLRLAAAQELAALNAAVAAMEQQEAEARSEAARIPGQRRDLEDVAKAVHGALKKAAREKSTRSWQELRVRLGRRALPSLDADEREQVLLIIDRQTAPDEPLIGTLLAGENEDSLQLHGRVSTALGRPLSTNVDELRAAVQTDTARLFEVWRGRWSNTR